MVIKLLTWLLELDRNMEKCFLFNALNKSLPKRKQFSNNHYLQRASNNVLNSVVKLTFFITFFSNILLFSTQT